MNTTLNSAYVVGKSLISMLLQRYNVGVCVCVCVHIITFQVQCVCGVSGTHIQS